MKKIFSNFFYQSVYQVLLIILPLITVPIVSKALGPTGIGTYNYINSIVNYFLLFAGLGLANYGIREIAIVRKNKEELSKKFWELQTFNVLIGFIVISAYLFFSSYQDNSNYYYLQSLILVGALFDISWFYQAIEEFKKITLASTIVKVLGLIGIVIFVNDASDLWIYILIQSSNILLSQLILWLFIFRKITFVKVSFKEAFFHLVPAIKYFIGKVTQTISLNLNKTLLGLIVTTTAVGYFSNAYLIITVLVSLVTTLDLVLLPKMISLVKEKNLKKMINLLQKTIHLEMFFTIPLFFGIIAINQKMVDWFFGNQFFEIKKILPLLGILVIIVPLGMAISRQYLIPMNQINKINFAGIIGALLSILSGLIFMPVYGLYGAVVAALVTEFFITGHRIFTIYRETSFRFDLFFISKIVFSSAIMLWIINIVTKDLPSSIFTTLLQCILGVFVYFCITTFLKVNLLISYLKKELKRKSTKKMKI